MHKAYRLGVKVKAQPVNQNKGENMKLKLKSAVLVYQAGIANVFRVESFNLADFGRNAVRMVQADFRTCEQFARGLEAAGVTVRTAACNMAGDIEAQPWTSDLESQPFSDEFNPINADLNLNRIIDGTTWQPSTH